MKPKCRLAVETALGRGIDHTEALAIEAHLKRALRQDARDRATWESRTPGARVLAAGARIAAERIDAAVGDRALLDRPAGRRYNQFAGARARGADGSAQLRAEELEADGLDVEAIWRETGWWRGLDGKWRYEIDDSAARFREGAVTRASDGVDKFKGRLGDLLDFPELFDAYPALADIEVSVKLNPLAGESGSWIPRDEGDQIRVNATDDARAVGILLHEVQHAIQTIEGFAQGSSLERVPRDFRQAYERALDVATETMAEQLALRGHTFQTLNLRHPAIYAEMMKELRATAATRVYLRVAGEMEARNVENRRGQGLDGAPGNKKLSSRARRRTPPSETFDTAPDQALFALGEGRNAVAIRSVSGTDLGPRPGGDGAQGPARPGGEPGADGRARGEGDVSASQRRPEENLGAWLDRALAQDPTPGAAGGDGVGAARGETFIPEGGVFADPGVIVTLFESADESTAVHEVLGHVFLETLSAYAARENAPTAVRDDLAIVRAWLGAEGDAPLTEDQHEQFARGVEAFLREGNAPSPGLAGIFVKFARWLSTIYRSVLDLDVELSDEMRDFYARYLKDFDNGRPGVLERGAGGVRDADAARSGGDGQGPAGRTGDPGDLRPADSGGGDASGGAAGSGRPGQSAPASPLNPEILARDPELKEIAEALADARAEIDALERQGSIQPAEAAQARADLLSVEKAAARPELFKAAAICLQYGARVNPGAA